MERWNAPVGSTPSEAATPGPCSTGNALGTHASDESAAALLEAGLAELDLHPEAERRQALLRLAALLARWSARINLTAHRTPAAIVHRLVLDAAALSVQLPALASLADLGAGAGFPGFPLAILRPSCRVTLIEARERRHHFQRAAQRELKLPNVRLELGRAEELPPEPHAAVIAQAVASPGAALPWMLRWAAPGGLLLLPGSERAPRVPEMDGVCFEALRRYRVPCGGPERTLWIGRAAA